jgi:beta-1,4-mannosyltransferase
VTRVRAARVRRLLREAAAARGTGVVWTVHNLMPHDTPRPRLDRSMYAETAAASDVLLAHSGYAADRFAATHGVDRSRFAIVPHGNYDGAYPPPSAPRDELRAALGLAPEHIVLLAFGQIRPYKRIPDVLRALRADPRPQLRLVVAGNDRTGTQLAELRELAAADDRVILELGFVEDQRVADLHALADAAVLNYRDVFSSGVLLLAWSLGLPVLVPEGTSAEELGEPPAVVPFGADGPLSAAGALLDGDRAAQRRSALDTAGRYGWNRIAGLVLEQYERSIARPASG